MRRPRRDVLCTPLVIPAKLALSEAEWGGNPDSLAFLSHCLTLGRGLRKNRMSPSSFPPVHDRARRQEGDPVVARALLLGLRRRLVFGAGRLRIPFGRGLLLVELALTLLLFLAFLLDLSPAFLETVLVPCQKRPPLTGISHINSLVQGCCIRATASCKVVCNPIRAARHAFSRICPAVAENRARVSRSSAATNHQGRPSAAAKSTRANTPPAPGCRVGPSPTDCQRELAPV